MKRFLKAAGAILGYIIAVGVFFTNKTMYIKKKSDEEILQREISGKRFNPFDYEALDKEEVSIKSPFGYEIKGQLTRTGHPHKFMIICHGVTVNKVNSIKYMNLFLKRGYNVLIYDHRRHGESGGKTTSYGHYEKFDLKACIDYLKSRFGESITLGIHGESMGAVTTLLYAGMVEDGADFYIADCPFSDFAAQLRYRLKVEFKIPHPFVMPFANLILKVRDGYRFKDVSPISVIKNIKNPVLFIHSKEDDYILPEMTKALYAEKEGYKKLFLAEKGAHAMSFAENPAEYEKAIDEFLLDIGSRQEAL